MLLVGDPQLHRPTIEVPAPGGCRHGRRSPGGGGCRAPGTSLGEGRTLTWVSALQVVCGAKALWGAISCCYEA